MPRYVVSLKDASALYGRIGDDIRRAAVRGIKKAAVRAVAKIHEVIDSKNPSPVDRSVYRGGWKILPLPNGAMVYNDELHAIFIEYGVRAENVKVGRKMIDALAEWGLRKGICDSDEAEEFAWAVANHMRQVGIFNESGPGLRILEQVMEGFVPFYVKQEVERAIARDVG